jgi:DNA (cytosine-5)-methyltransferase 1
MSYPVISLFSGAGGLDLGLERAGFEVRVCVEVESFCQETLNLNRHKMRRGKHLKIFGDINEVSPSELLKAARLTPGEAFLVAGGPPCQPFSTAGRRLSVQDPRGKLFYRYVEMIKFLRPRFFFFENVRGILSAAIKHRPRNKRGSEFPPLEPEEELGSLLKYEILPAFREILGYEVVYGIIKFANYGVPQNRERVIFLGSRDGELGSIKWLQQEKEMPITHLFPKIRDRHGKSGLKKWINLGEALNCLDDPNPEYIPYSPERKCIFNLIPPGGNWRYIRDHYDVELAKKIMGGCLLF